MIADVITNLASFSLPGFLTVIGVFGFAPGFCMRLIALMYPRTDPRRRELYAEMKAVPRIERPLWVAEQLETGLFEGPTSRRRAAKERKRRKSKSDHSEGTSDLARELQPSVTEEELLRVLRRHGADKDAVTREIKRKGLEATWQDVAAQLLTTDRP